MDWLMIRNPFRLRKTTVSCAMLTAFKNRGLRPAALNEGGLDRPHVHWRAVGYPPATRPFFFAVPNSSAQRSRPMEAASR
jgi:hypothetical protein